MDQLLSEREKVNAHLRDVIDAPTEQPWGIRVERVEVKDVALPESMKRSMSRQAEAERERRARIISADGEYQASKKLAQAAMVMAADPAALQLRLLQTVVEVAAEKNSTLVMPVPVELLRFFDRAALASGQAEPSAAGAQDTGAAPLPVPALTVPASASVTASLNGAPNKTPAAFLTTPRPVNSSATTYSFLTASSTHAIAAIPTSHSVSSSNCGDSTRLRRDRQQLSYAAGR